MSQKKKIVYITSAIIIVIAIIIGIVSWINFGAKKEDTIVEGENSQISKLYTELKEKQQFSFTTTLDENNKIYYAKKDNTAYLDTIYQGDETKVLVKDGNSYLLVDDEKKYYTYQNNETDLNKVLDELEAIKDRSYTRGKEKIEGKQYNYEELEGVTGFFTKNVEEQEEQKEITKFYYKGNQLAYIKTIVGDKEELLKIDISYDVDDKLFEMPTDYQEF